MSCLKTSPWSSTGKTLHRTHSRTRPRLCIHIVSCSSHLAHRCPPHSVSRFDGTFLIYRVSSLVNGYPCYSRTHRSRMFSPLLLLVCRMLLFIDALGMSDLALLFSAVAVCSFFHHHCLDLACMNVACNFSFRDGLLWIDLSLDCLFLSSFRSFLIGPRTHRVTCCRRVLHVD